METVEKFFDFARERHRVYIARQEGARWPWTKDPILQEYKFTNVFRELDATTVWFRDHIREPMRTTPEVMLATVVFRWFNRTTTAEAIFLQRRLDLNSGGSLTAWGEFLRTGSAEEMWAAILLHCGAGPYVTGAYIIKTPDGFTKLSGVLKSCEWFVQSAPVYAGTVAMDWRQMAELLLREPAAHTLEDVWRWLREHPFLGDFMAYELVSDLRHTDLLSQAPDIMTWANPGPGAMRGLSRMHDRPLNKRVSKGQANEEMKDILHHSLRLWPEGWPRWEMRDVEHTLCEWDKYERVRLGQGKMKGRYKHV